MPDERIIQEAMAEASIKAADVPKELPFNPRKDYNNSKRYFESKGFAQFQCTNKHHWYDSNSHCFLDLKAQTICYKHKQNCSKCERTAPPNFTRDAVESMVAKAIKKYLIQHPPRKGKC